MKTLFLFVALLPALAGAQTTDTDAPESEESIDEITVVGARSLGSMRAEVLRAEDVAYALFNELNDDDGYDIICKKETRIGSQIPKRVCLARMYRNAVAEATVDDEGTGPLPVGNLTRSSKHQKILIEKMRALSEQHPELKQALQQRFVLEKKFETERDRRYGD